MKDIMNPKLSPKTIQRVLWMGALLFSVAAASASTSVTFQVDMSNFTIPAGDTVSVNGSFDGWSGNHTMTNNPAAVNPNLYTGTVTNTSVAAGAVMDYQYRLVEANGTTVDDYSSQADGDNYCALIPANGGSLATPYEYWDDDGTAVANSITFQVDMAEQLHLGNFNTNYPVFCNGSFEGAGWDFTFQLANNPAQNVTNGQGIITSLPYTGTYTTWSASPGAAAEYKFVYTNLAINPTATNYEAPLLGDPDNGQNRFFQNAAQVLPLVNFSDAPFSATVTNNVTFLIDMSVQAAVGNFNVANGNTVEIHGDYNGWGAGTTMTNSPTDPDTNHFYFSYQYIAGQGTLAYFKYVIQPGTQWENVSAANQIGGNRWLTQVNGNTALPLVYFSDEGPNTLPDFITVTNCMVTFTVDMSPATNASYTGNNGRNFIIGFDNVYLNGLNGGLNNSFWTWAPGGVAPPPYEMVEVPADSVSPIYQLTVPVNQGQSVDLIYKYGINGGDYEAGFGDNHTRYIRSIPNYAMPTDAYGSQGSSTSSELSFGNLVAAKSSGNIVLTWLGRTGVHLQKTTSLTPPIVWTQLPLTDGTNLIVTQGPGTSPSVGYAGTNYSSVSGNTYFELIGPP
jgi:hypothetical protein